MNKKIVRDLILSTILMIILLMWVSLLTWVDFNKTLFGRLLGLSIGLIVGLTVIIIQSIMVYLKMKKGEQIVDERIIKIRQKVESLTIYSLYIVFVILGMLFFALYYFGYKDGKIISYTFAYILVGMSIIRLPIYYYLKNKM